MPPLVASAVINFALLVSALLQAPPSSSSTALPRAASAKVGATTSVLEHGTDLAGSTPSLRTTTTASTELALGALGAFAAPAPSTAAPQAAPPPPTAAPSTSSTEPPPAGPTTAAPTTEPQLEPVALPASSTAPTTIPSTPTSGNGGDDREDEREARRQAREEAHAARRTSTTAATDG
ncbi:MAG: hypothetical protein O3C27_01430 [Actinomycetota bacterium]|nr:hypothetical protein [Actinomycetota bacterium]